ncbi:MAG: TlpA family protein disulfide reductase [Anaerolineae bacterium]
MVSSTVELHQQYGDQLVVIGLDVQESPEVVRPFVAEHGMTYLNLIADAPTLERYDVRAHPLTVLITA